MLRLSEQFVKVPFPECDGVTHFRHVIVTLVHTNDPGLRAGDVVEQTLDDLYTDTKPLETGGVGSSKVV
jgi:hypothetical protein